MPLISSKDLSETPIRCQRMLMRFLRFNVTAMYTPGKNMLVADHLSRSPSPTEYKEHFVTEDDVEAQVSSITSNWSVSDARLDKIKAESQRDVQLKYAMQYTTEAVQGRRRTSSQRLVRSARRTECGQRNSHHRGENRHTILDATRNLGYYP